LAWTKCLEETAWWKREVEDPCMLLLTKTASLGVLIGEDALIERPGGASGVSGADGAREAGAGVRPRPGTGGTGEGLRTPPKKKHHNVQGGQYTTNRSNVPLCPDFQLDGCQAKVNNIGRCQKGSHQCGRCLSKDHGAGACTKPEPPDMKFDRGGKKGGGGGKKGKGRGKGGGYY
jgi:hypothetical protein